MHFRGFDSSIILMIRGGILMSIGNFLESLSPAMLVGITLVGTLGVAKKGTSSFRGQHQHRSTVGFHDFNLRIFNLRVSNPDKLIVDVLLTRCRISICQGLGPKKHDEISEIDRIQQTRRPVVVQCQWLCRRQAVSTAA